MGLFALIEILLFFLGLSPLIAFPIMTTAGALQQPELMSNDEAEIALELLESELAGFLTEPFRKFVLTMQWASAWLMFHHLHALRGFSMR